MVNVQYDSDDYFYWLMDNIEYYSLKDEEPPENFSYFKIDNRITSKEFVDSVSKQIIKHKESKLPEEEKIIEFRGYKLDLEELERAYASDLFYSRSTVFIIHKDTEKYFNFKPLKLPVLADPEICEYCDEVLPLPISCDCKTAFYCSIRCRIKNISFHKKYCDQAVNIQGLLTLDEEEKFQTDKINDKLGLINMGNSCYLASVFQVLRHYQPFSDFLLSLDRTEMETINKGPLNIFPFLKDGFMQMNFTSSKEYAPYLLKGAIGVKNNTVDAS